MSGLDEIKFLENCTYCDKTSASYLIYGKREQQIGVFNIDEHLIKLYGMVNSELFRNKGLDAFMDAFGYLECGKCKNKIYDKRLIQHTIINHLEKRT